MTGPPGYLMVALAKAGESVDISGLVSGLKKSKGEEREKGNEKGLSSGGGTVGGEDDSDDLMLGVNLTVNGTKLWQVSRSIFVCVFVFNVFSLFIYLSFLSFFLCFSFKQSIYL